MWYGCVIVQTISHRRSTVPIVSIFFCFHLRWRLSSYFPCVNSLPYNCRSPFKCKLISNEGSKGKMAERKRAYVPKSPSFVSSNFTEWDPEQARKLIQESARLHPPPVVIFVRPAPKFTPKFDVRRRDNKSMRALRMLYSLKRNEEWDALRWQRRITSCLLARSWVGNEGNNLKSMGRLLVLLYILEN